MAEIKVQCPRCGVRYWVDEEFLGETVECEDCDTSFTITPVAPGGQEAPEGIDLDAPSFVLEELGLAWVAVPPATFLRGAENGTPSEKPVHAVTLTGRFWLGKGPVTQEQYQQLVGRNPSYHRGAQRPVENVSWHQAVEFCRRLTQRLRAEERLPEDARFCLPTESQWEYACSTFPDREGPERGTGTAEDPYVPSAYGYGNDADRLGEYAWYEANSDGVTHEVAAKKPSVRGFYDMHGNVAEWVADWFGSYGSEPVTDPAGAESGTRRVVRGGSYGAVPWRCRASDRLGVLPDTRCALIGFRVALVLDR